jgi:dTDP-4-dehydrorhamnose reductase
MVHHEVKNIVIFGKNGQVSSNLVELFAKENGMENNLNVQAYSSSEVNFLNLPALGNFLNNLSATSSFRPDFIINASAYTNVDKAEDEKELADLINNQAVEIIAKYCAKNNVKLIHYSTDYVFDGSGTEAFREDNIANLHPLNYYGETKLLGEQKIIQSGCEYLILRTSWIYNQDGKNFVNSMIKLAKERESLEVVSDQIGSPTYAYDIALYTVQIVKQLLSWQVEFPSGIYNLTNLGSTSRYDFAVEIFRILAERGVALKLKSCKKTKMIEYDNLARPMNCLLDNHKVQNLFNLSIRNWQNALRACITSNPQI